MGLPAHEVVFIFLKWTHKAIGFLYSSTSTKFSLQPIFIFVFKLYANSKRSRKPAQSPFWTIKCLFDSSNLKILGQRLWRLVLNSSEKLWHLLNCSSVARSQSICRSRSHCNRVELSNTLADPYLYPSLISDVCLEVVRLPKYYSVRSMQMIFQ